MIFFIFENCIVRFMDDITLSFFAENVPILTHKEG